MNGLTHQRLRPTAGPDRQISWPDFNMLRAAAFVRVARATIGRTALSSNAAPATPASVGEVSLTTEENLTLRRRHLAPSQRIHYDGTDAGPLHLERGEGAYLYDINNVRHLDCVNNVAHVGHCHPSVVAATARQLAKLNTNSRYVHDNISRLAAALAAKFPEPLSSVFFVNSGTEERPAPPGQYKYASPKTSWASISTPFQVDPKIFRCVSLLSVAIFI